MVPDRPEGLIHAPSDYEPGLRGFFRSRFRRIQFEVKNWGDEWYLFITNPIGMIGVVIILLFVVLALAQPILLGTVWDVQTYDPLMGHDINIESHPSTPSMAHWLGTDYLGRDVLSQLAFATRTSLGVGVTAAIVGMIVSTLIGVVAAYFGGVVDSILMTLTGAFLLMPPAVVLLTVGLIFELSSFQVGLIYGIFAGLGSLAIMVKSHALTIKSKQYIDAGHTAGGGHWRIIRVHILPNLASMLAMNMMFIVTGSVMVEALISFATQTTTRYSWGTMIWFIQNNFRGGAVGLQWHVIIAPALAIMLFCGAFYMIGRSLNDLVNPRLKEK